MLGAVFHQEMLIGGRRSRLHVLRWVYVGWLVLQIVFLWFGFLYLQMQHKKAVQPPLTGYYGVNPFTGAPLTPGALPEAPPPDNPASAPGVVGQWFVEGNDDSLLGRLFFPGFVRSQMLMLLLATPAFVAGAVADEKRRGTLQYLLAADLDTRHLILGKMFGRVAQVGLLTLAGVPLFAAMAGFCGVESSTVIVGFLVLLAPLFALSCATILASVLCRQASDAVLAMYFFSLLGCLLVGLIGGPLRFLDPMYAVEAAKAPWGALAWNELGVRFGVEVAVWGLFGCVCLFVAVRRLRPVYIRELEGPSTKLAWYQGDRVPIGDDPVRWRERYVERLMPAGLKAFFMPLVLVPYSLIAFFTPKSAAGRAHFLSLWPGIVATAALTTVSSLSILWHHLPARATLQAAAAALTHLDFGALVAMRPVNAESGFQVQGLVTMLAASFIVGVRCSGGITGERERQTWEAVLLTPLSAKQLVSAKLWGVMSACYWYLLAYAAPAVLLSALGGWWALFWTAAWLAVTVLSMYFLGAAGVWCSARSKTSWRSLLGTMAVGYLVGAGLYLGGAIFATAFSCIILNLASSGTNPLYPAAPANEPAVISLAWWAWLVPSPPFVALSCGILTLIFLGLPRMFLGWAQRWIADRERTRHWHEEPFYRRPRREPAYPPPYYP